MSTYTFNSVLPGILDIPEVNRHHMLIAAMYKYYLDTQSNMTSHVYRRHVQIASPFHATNVFSHGNVGFRNILQAITTISYSIYTESR